MHWACLKWWIVHSLVVFASKDPHQTPAPAVLETLARLPQIPLLLGQDRGKPCQNFSKRRQRGLFVKATLHQWLYAGAKRVSGLNWDFRSPGQTSAGKQQRKVFNSCEWGGDRHVYMFELNPTPACLSRMKMLDWDPGPPAFLGFGWLSQSLNRNERLTEKSLL